MPRTLQPKNRIADSRWRSQDGVPGGVSHKRNRLWRFAKSGKRRRPIKGGAAQLRPAGGTEYAATYDLPDQAYESESGDLRGGQSWLKKSAPPIQEALR